MSQFVAHIKIALENTVLCRGANPAKESYDYAKKMEKMLKSQLKQELLEIVKDRTMMEERLCELIGKLESDEESKGGN